MSFLKFLRKFKISTRKTRVPNRVVAVPEHDGEDCEKLDSAKPKRFKWEEVKSLTTNFSEVIGSGGFSTVYLAQFPDSRLGAVKVQCSCSERLNQVYNQELQTLLLLNHPNIVKLLGYCDDEREENRALLFEYVPKGTLHEKLHGRGGSLSWRRRMSVAFQVAQAMEFLHEMCGLQIVHGDLKSSNVLIDEELNCKLCDFGSAKMGFCSTVVPQSSSTSSMNRMRILVGSHGYVDPYYLKTGIASKKNDVHSFGVIVLELITGMEAFCLENGEKLTSKVGQFVNDDDGMKVGEMVDARLDGEFDLEEAKVMAKIAVMCLCNSPSLRPSATEILAIMREKIPSISFLFDERFQEFTACTK